MYPSRIAPLFLPSLACLAMLSGCSTARMDSQWIDRSFHDGLAAGARVFVSCETGDDSLRRLCEDAEQQGGAQGHGRESSAVSRVLRLGATSCTGGARVVA